ncbi:hypothetical protein KKF81_07270 [Candidatus Micrarchaeota archaeon]|nr:hypothetical protein [Candidatus Micrarchaeota archaeon]MBU1166729.1 hypothetical protein [Candidatus Micrarchaeota archaeon]MBU1886692.1 hypothetical protein [Candidatus Micrarchaeota archaeon]
MLILQKRDYPKLPTPALDRVIASRKQMLAELGCLAPLIETDIALASLRSSSRRVAALPQSDRLTVLTEPANSSERLQTTSSSDRLPKEAINPE